MKTDKEIMQDLQAHLKSEVGVNAGGIRVLVINGIVALEGSVTSYADRVDAINAIKRAEDVLAWADIHWNYSPMWFGIRIAR
jgi:osmotically-inducible protein OsmY